MQSQRGQLADLSPVSHRKRMNKNKTGTAVVFWARCFLLILVERG
jgi:hypothetical protein